MLDEFREQAGVEMYSDEEEETFEEVKPLKPKTRRMGLTAVQRLVLSMLFLMTVCVLGALFLVVTGKIVPVF
jgi:hypothetical protein